MDIMTNFVNIGQLRRKPVVTALSDKFLNYKNIAGVFDLDGLENCTLIQKYF